MTGRDMTPPEWAAKVDNEGGLYNAVTGYGLDETDLNRLKDPLFYDLVEEYVLKARELDAFGAELESMLEDYYEQFNSEE